MARQLVSHVHVFNEDKGDYEVLAGGTPEGDVPAWAVKAMGDHVWVDDSKDADEGGEPPRSGAGSGKQAWTDFAAANGVEVGDDDTRDDIIAKLADAGVVEA